jgi:hypothetical protein
VTAPSSGAEPTRDQIRRLRRDGATIRSIAAAAGLAPTTVHDISAGRQAPTPHTARALAAIASASPRRVRVDAGGTRLRLRALHVMGHGSARIARALGAREMTIRTITRGDAATVSAKLRDDVADLYDSWWDKRAPAPTAPPPPPPAAAPSPATGAPAPASTTTNSTPPATGRKANGSPPPAPAPPPTSSPPTATATTARTLKPPGSSRR